MNRSSVLVCKVLLYLLLGVVKQSSSLKSSTAATTSSLINQRVVPLPTRSTHNYINHNHLNNQFSRSLTRRKDISLKALHTALISSEWQLWSVLSVMSTLGILSEKTYIGSMLSSPIVTMVATLILANIGLIPASSPVYDIVMKKFVPLAIPLLLLDADLRKCIKVTGRLLRAFLVGAVGTVVGTLVAFLLVPMKNIVGGDKIASALCARHVRTLIIINEIYHHYHLHYYYHHYYLDWWRC